MTFKTIHFKNKDKNTGKVEQHLSNTEDLEDKRLLFYFCSFKNTRYSWTCDAASHSSDALILKRILCGTLLV